MSRVATATPHRHQSADDSSPPLLDLLKSTFPVREVHSIDHLIVDSTLCTEHRLTSLSICLIGENKRLAPQQAKKEKFVSCFAMIRCMSNGENIHTRTGMMRGMETIA